MPVLTQKEYKEKNKDSIGDISPIESSNSIVLPEEKTVKKETVYEYRLMHPENPKDFPLDFQDTLTIEGNEYLRECKRGIVTTIHKPLADFLMKKGYELMYKEKI